MINDQLTKSTLYSNLSRDQTNDLGREEDKNNDKRKKKKNFINW
jgi:hypothetical protein